MIGSQRPGKAQTRVYDVTMQMHQRIEALKQKARQQLSERQKVTTKLGSELALKEEALRSALVLLEDHGIGQPSSLQNELFRSHNHHSPRNAADCAAPPSRPFRPAGIVDEAQDNAALRRRRLRRLFRAGGLEHRGDLAADDAAPLEQLARHRDQRRPVSLE
jgi:hypothetical protein